MTESHSYYKYSSFLYYFPVSEEGDIEVSEMATARKSADLQGWVPTSDRLFVVYGHSAIL
jgi:hypothetical protein